MRQGAPYFNLGDANNNNSLSGSDVIKILKASSESSPIDNNYAENVGFATYYKLSTLYCEMC